jgi:hypothetical protein
MTARPRLPHRRGAIALDIEHAATVRRRSSQFLLRLEATRGNAIHDVRAILKALLRRHRFRCLDCREAP